MAFGLRRDMTLRSHVGPQCLYGNLLPQGKCQSHGNQVPAVSDKHNIYFSLLLLASYLLHIISVLLLLKEEDNQIHITEIAAKVKQSHSALCK